MVAGLDETGKAGIVTTGPELCGELWTVQGHHSRVEESLPSARSSEGEK